MRPRGGEEAGKDRGDRRRRRRRGRGRDGRGGPDGRGPGGGERGGRSHEHAPHAAPRELDGAAAEPAPPTVRELNEYIYFRRNVAGVQREWWSHRTGCELWFVAERDTRTNEVQRIELPESPPDDAA